MALWTEVAELARRQHGLVARRQLVKLGVPSASVSKHARHAGWRQTHRGVYVLPGAVMDHEQEIMAAILRLGENAMASHLTAARLHGLVQLRPPVIDVLLPFECRGRVVPGVHVTRTRTLKPADRCLVSGIPCTTLPRTIIDAATVLEPPGIRALVIDARQRRSLDLGRVARRLLDIGPIRHSGELRRILVELDASRVDSVLEERARAALRNAGVPAPYPAPYPVQAGGWEVEIDIAWPDHKVGVEVDGYGGHAGRESMDKDHRKQNALILAGWTILRVGWDRLAVDRQGFAAEVEAVLAAAM